MAKKVGNLFIILLLIVSITACSRTTGSKTNETSTQNITQYGIPERKNDMQGQVKSIRGNEITVYKVIGEQLEQLELTEEEKEKRRLERQTLSQERQNLSPEEKQKLKEDRTNISNETQAFIVPVGVPIISVQNAGTNPEITKMDLADVKNGSLLKIWFTPDSDNEEAEFIQIMNSGGM